LRNEDFDKDVLVIRLQRLSKLINFELNTQLDKYSSKSLNKEDNQIYFSSLTLLN